MPRNTIASKLAIRLLNTSKDKIITILTPKVEFIVANTKIK